MVQPSTLEDFGFFRPQPALKAGSPGPPPPVSYREEGDGRVGLLGVEDTHETHG